jgi:hypothetical protein
LAGAQKVECRAAADWVCGLREAALMEEDGIELSGVSKTIDSLN